MLPVITLVGQKNVGKSTLFNRLTCAHDALVADFPGLTRDRQYGYLRCDRFDSVLVDTGGLDDFCASKKIVVIQNCISIQAMIAIKEANIVLCVIDGRYGEESSTDYYIINFLRKLNKEIIVVVNKIDNILSYKREIINSYYSFGMDYVVPISAIHGYGINSLLKKISYKIIKDTVHCINDVSIVHKKVDCLLNNDNVKHSKSSSCDVKDFAVTVAVVGCPNVGKSTFVNHVVGTDRMIVCGTPGTTRDSIYIPVVYNNQKYILVDTAGIRKQKKIIDHVAEQIAVLKTFKVIKDVHVVLFMIDVNMGISDQDLSILRFIVDNGRALVVVFNKWDSLSSDVRRKFKVAFLRRKMKFIDFVRVHFISALYGDKIATVFQSIQEAYRCSIQTINTARLIRVMHRAIVACPPPLLNGRRIRPKYVHIGRYSPVLLVIHGSQVSKLSDDYQRYLKNYFYRELKIMGSFLHIQFKDTVNPFLRHKRL